MNDIKFIEELVFSTAYGAIVLFIVLYFIIEYINEKDFKLFNKKQYTYGFVLSTPARKNNKTGEVQFVLWKAGEQGHKEDYWIRFDSSWWSQFKPEINDEKI